MTFRKVLFWLHLLCGVFAGVVVLIMSVTGVLLTYERQMIAWSDSGYRAAPISAGAARVPLEHLLLKVSVEESITPSSITVRSDSLEPASIGYGRRQSVYVNPYSGEVLGQGSQGIRDAFRVITDWHRWLGAGADSRTFGRSITGACNLAFLFIVMSGLYLWWPRNWSRDALKSVTWFRGGLKGRARDFNWHNVIGLWCFTPLLIIVFSGAVISYPWMSDLLYTVTGSEAPARRGRGPGGPSRGGAEPGAEKHDVAKWAGLDQQLALAKREAADWKSITLRLPSSADAPATFSIDRGNGARPDLRSQVTIERGTGKIVEREIFADGSLGRRLRSWLRWLHTGEAGGLAGQTIAGIASAGAAVLVWTGLALTWRRFRGWLSRRRSTNGEAST